MTEVAIDAGRARDGAYEDESANVAQPTGEPISECRHGRVHDPADRRHGDGEADQSQRDRQPARHGVKMGSGGAGVEERYRLCVSR